MNSMNPNSDERKEDSPPFSRIFVVCSKQLREENLRKPFSQFGEIEDLYMPRDRNTGDSKGIAYIKYQKTSAAAAAIEEMHMKYIGTENKPLKVMMASTNRNNPENNIENKYKRLFIKTPKDMTENEIREAFSVFGYVRSVMIQKDKTTLENKGFAYVNFTTFLETARAYEGCDKKFKPVFATPRETLKRSSYDLDLFPGSSQMTAIMPTRDNYYDYDRDTMPKRQLSSLITTKPQGYTSVDVTCSLPVSQKHIERLFSIIPGFQQCEYSVDTDNCLCKATVSYETQEAAAHAVDRLNNFEYPSGETIVVKPVNPLNKAANELSNIVNNFKSALDSGCPNFMMIANVIAKASSLIASAASLSSDKDFCSVPLPPKQELVKEQNAVVEKRCFLVCKPQPPPQAALEDAFCRFGNLIDVMTFPNKIFGFAKYASVDSAMRAIKTLNDATILGVKLKVIEADEKMSKEEQNGIELGEGIDDLNVENKKLKLMSD